MNRKERALFLFRRVFDNEINVAIHASHAAYSNMLFKEALKTGTYDLQNARDAYRVACGPLGMHKDLVHRYIKVRPGNACSFGQGGVGQSWLGGV